MDLIRGPRFGPWDTLAISALCLGLLSGMVGAETSPRISGNASSGPEELDDKRAQDSISTTPYPDKRRVSPLVNLDVNLTSVLTHANPYLDNVEINGVIFWQLHPDVAHRLERVEISFTSPEADCAEDYAALHRILPGNSTSWNISRQPHSTERRILKFGCTYSMEIEVWPCYGCEVISYNFTIGKCVGQLCQCSYCHAHICQCQRPELEAPFDQHFRLMEPSGSGRDTALLGWRYRRQGSKTVATTLFRVTIYWHDAVAPGDEAILANQTDLSVWYAEGVSDYNVTFDVLPNKIYCVQVVATSTNETFCSDASLLRFATNATDYPEVEPAPPESRSLVLVLFLSTFSGFAFLAISGFVFWRKWIANGGRAIGLHALQNHRVQYQSSASSKSSCLTKGTYLSTEREDINVLYVEQEIQEARDKGIVDFFEISYGRLQIGQEIGKGAFGRVCIATAEAIMATPGRATVAVKYLRENPKDQEKEDFLAEIATMKKAGHHPNVVTMLACCTLQQPYCMVMEYVPGGDLLNYLRRLRSQYEKVTGRLVGLASCETSNGGKDSSKLSSLEWANEEKNASNEKLINEDYQRRAGKATEASGCGQPADGGPEVQSGSSKSASETAGLLSHWPRNDISPTAPVSDSSAGWEADSVCLDPLELQSFALQIASGMNHLSSRNIVHRDLAARNVLIDQCKRLKVADFGLSRSGVYVTQRGGRVPLRWLSLEAIRDNVYSTASDVWAFGVVLWEICTLGGFPYSDTSDKDLFGHLLRGNRLKRPLHCSQELYILMMSCWSSCPKARPDFGDLCDTLAQLSRNEHTYVNFDLPEVNGAQLPPAVQQRVEEQPEETSRDTFFPDFN